MGTIEESKVSRDMADAEFNRFIESMDVDVDESEMDSEDKAAFNKQRNKIVKAIEKGTLVINDSGEAVLTPANEKSKHKDAITFHERTGASLLAMDGHNKHQDAAKTYAVMADMCRVPRKVFAGLVGSDIKICEAIFALLMD